MFKKLINIKIILLTIIITSSCGLSIPGTKTHDQEMQAIYDMTSSMNHNNKQGQDPYDVNDLNGCIIPFKIDQWEFDDGSTWGRYEKWLRGTSSIISTGSTVDYPYTSQKIQDLVTRKDKSQPEHSYIYIGPWKYSKTIDKKIRFVAFQEKGFAMLTYTFVSFDNFASKIKERPFSLRKDYPLPTLDSLCKVKWMAKFGYNTIAETHYPGFLNSMLKTDIQLTGKLIELEN
jgi:hypothetical protein